ncbi:gamma aminobutyric acid receptor subunit [Brachionus plicatilis]|uniref:Gamma aminobutyric acid receptor subunit n=1 Tax=Brachionus plicatilis TaxID=10195 RepID=A0A3M7RI52_BRAPC|nr:gamma aminobutyric acid receptor subunit [Brachionus plicatilis]
MLSLKILLIKSIYKSLLNIILEKVISFFTKKSLKWPKIFCMVFSFCGVNITITSSRSINEVKFVPSSHIESTINTNDFQQQQEWNLYPHIETSEKNIYDIWKQQERPCFTVSSTISRRPGYFIYNAYMLIFLISALGFVPFSFNHSFPHFRIQTTCLLILSSINFRWIVTQKLPTVSYLTTLDKYAIVALIFLVSLCAWHAVIGSVLFSSIDKEYVGGIDKYALFFIGTYFLFRYRRYSHVGKEQANEDLKQDNDVKNTTKTVVELTQDVPSDNPRKNNSKWNSANIRHYEFISEIIINKYSIPNTKSKIIKY